MLEKAGSSAFSYGIAERGKIDEETELYMVIAVCYDD